MIRCRGTSRHALPLSLKRTLVDEIDKALQARDERATKIAEAVVADIDSIPEPTAHAYGKRTAGLAIAAAIRKDN